MSIINNDFKDIVYGRHSVKEFDSSYKIPKKEMLEIIREATKAPSSINMQPWRFVVVESQEGKDKLRPLIRFNVRQNDTSSAMILIFGDLECYKNGADIYNRAVEKGYMPNEVRNMMLENFLPWYENASKKEMNDIVKIDSSLAAMQLMLIARAHGYETNAIGGFEANQLAEAFDLDKDRYVPVLIVAIGKGAKVAHESVRLEAEEITMFK